MINRHPAPNSPNRSVYPLGQSFPSSSGDPWTSGIGGAGAPALRPHARGVRRPRGDRSPTCPPPLGELRGRPRLECAARRTTASASTGTAADLAHNAVVTTRKDLLKQLGTERPSNEQSSSASTTMDSHQRCGGTASVTSLAPGRKAGASLANILDGTLDSDLPLCNGPAAGTDHVAAVRDARRGGTSRHGEADHARHDTAVKRPLGLVPSIDAAHGTGGLPITHIADAGGRCSSDLGAHHWDGLYSAAAVPGAAVSVIRTASRDDAGARSTRRRLTGKQRSPALPSVHDALLPAAAPATPSLVLLPRRDVDPRDAEQTHAVAGLASGRPPGGGPTP